MSAPLAYNSKCLSRMDKIGCKAVWFKSRKIFILLICSALLWKTSFFWGSFCPPSSRRWPGETTSSFRLQVGDDLEKRPTVFSSCPPSSRGWLGETTFSFCLPSSRGWLWETTSSFLLLSAFKSRMALRNDQQPSPSVRRQVGDDFEIRPAEFFSPCRTLMRLQTSLCLRTFLLPGVILDHCFVCFHSKRGGGGVKR